MNCRINGALAKTSRRRVALTAALAVAALTLAGCSTTSPNSTSSKSASTFPSSMSALVKQANIEGEVNWSAPKVQSQMQGAIDLFEQKYPGITVKFTNTKAPDQVTQLKVQQAAKKVAVDVAAAGGLTVPPSLGLADTVNWTDYGVVKGDVQFDGKLIYIWASPKVWAYNTTKLKSADVPHSWDDLLHTGLANGQIAIESRASFMAIWKSNPKMGQSAGLAWAKKLAALQPHYTPTTTESEQLIESGQTAIGTSLINLALAGKKTGAPVAIAPVTPVSTNETYIYVPKGAPHPAAAALFASFLSSPAAQNVLAKSYNSRIPLNTDCTHLDENAVVKILCDAGVKWYGTGSLSDYNSLANFFPEAEKALGTYVG